MNVFTPFLIMGLFVVLQVLYYSGFFKRFRNRWIPLMLFVGISTVLIVLSLLF